MSTQAITLTVSITAPSGRIRNSFLKAINEQAMLPKFIVVILDDDLTVSLDHYQDPYYIIHQVTGWLMREFERSIEAYKDMIPQKVKRTKFPQFIWISPPSHKHFGRINNGLRNIQSICLEELVTTHNNMTSLKLIKFWDPEDGNLFLKNEYRFTNEGLNRYWEAVDSAVHYWSIIGHKKKESSKRAPKNFTSR